MPIRELRSQRLARLAGVKADVFQYEVVPGPLRAQFIHILDDVFRNSEGYSDYEEVVEALRREFGKLSLANALRKHLLKTLFREEFVQYFMTCSDDMQILDTIELCANHIDEIKISHEELKRDLSVASCEDAIDEINQRMKFHGLGFLYSNSELIRIDSQFIHSEAVQPTLRILQQSGYESASAEFISAYEHYRHGRMREALIDALKSFESVMKIICAKRQWQHKQQPSASELVNICLANDLIPAYWQTYFAGLRAVLESAIPTPRNRQGGHGAGTQPVQEPPGELISYVLHMTASTILFLTEAESRLP